MNLLDRIKSGLWISIILVLFGCESSDEGLEIVIDNRTIVAFEEFDLSTTNLILDSLRTDDGATNRVVTGKYVDDLLGEVTAKAFLKYRLTSGVAITDSSRIDSMVFSFKVDQVLKNNTNLLENFLIYELEERIFDDVIYLSSFESALSRQPIDTFVMRVQDDGMLSKNFLNTYFGRYIESMLRGADTIVLGMTGELGIIPLDDSGNLVSLDLESDSSQFIIYSSDSAGIYVSQFRFSEHYSSLERNFSGSFTGGTTNLDTPSISEDFTVVNPIFGINTLVDLSPVIEFASANENIIINRAEMVAPLSSTSVAPLEELKYFFFDENYGIRGEGEFRDPFLTMILPNRFYINASGSDSFFTGPDSTSYNTDVTLFSELFITQLNQGEILAEKFVMTGNKILDLNESRISTEGIKFRLYYTTIN